METFGAAATELGRDRAYEADGLIAHLTEVAAGRASWDSRAGVRRLRPEDAPPDFCKYLTGADGNPSRWFAFDSGQAVSMSAQRAGDSSLADGGLPEIDAALANWMEVAGTSVNVVFAGPTDYALSCSGAGPHQPHSPDNVVVFNDPCSDEGDLVDCSGLLAVGGFNYELTTTPFAGGAWHKIVSWFVVVNNGTGCIGPVLYVRAMTHELGHGLGFAHTPDRTSIMFPECCFDLFPNDRTCLQSAYPAAISPAPSPEFAPPAIDPVPGQAVAFAASAAGGPTSSWLWDFGDGATSTLPALSHAFAAEGIYRVRLTAMNAFGSKTISHRVIVASRARAVRPAAGAVRTPRRVGR